MGLDLVLTNGGEQQDHICHWSYSHFDRVRRHVALMSGYELDKMAGYSDRIFRPVKSWANEPAHVRAFFEHSDCDGQWTPQECEQMLPWLLETALNTLLDGNVYTAGDILTLCDAMSRSALWGHTVEFF